MKRDTEGFSSRDKPFQQIPLYENIINNYFCKKV